MYFKYVLYISSGGLPVVGNFFFLGWKGKGTERTKSENLFSRNFTFHFISLSV